MSLIRQGGAQRTDWSTAEVGAEDAFGYWADVICEALVQVSARPVSDDVFEGRVSNFALDELGLSVVSSGAQTVERTNRLIARSGQDYLLANIQLHGRAAVRQDGRATLLSPGEMTFVESTRPYSMSFEGVFSQLIVRVPRSLITRRPVTKATAMSLGPDGPGGLVAGFFIGLERLEPAAAAALVPHSIGLLEAALDWASRADAAPNSALTRERVHRFVHRHAGNPQLNAAAVAAGCDISRRTLFRALAEDRVPLTVLIRRQRVARAQQLLRSAPQLPLAVVAREAGFGGPAQLNRAFQLVLKTTPGEYRVAGADRHHSGHS